MTGWTKLMANEQSIAVARRVVAKALSDVGWQGNRDDAALVTSELATNAVQETWRWELGQRTSLREMEEAELMAMAGAGWGEMYVAVGLYLVGHDAVIEAWDCSRNAPKVKAFGEDMAESGRGLMMIEMIAKRWGYRWVRPCGGKVVYAVLEGGC